MVNKQDYSQRDWRNIAPRVTIRDVYDNEAVNIAELNIKSGEYPHGHSAVNQVCTMVLYCVSGECTIRLKDTEKTLSAGGVVEVLPQTAYKYVAEDTTLLLTSTPGWRPEQYEEVA